MAVRAGVVDPIDRTSSARDALRLTTTLQGDEEPIGALDKQVGEAVFASPVAKL
ncbi:hypothetical protein Isolate57596_50740 (plasmid) [Mycobacteroides abscessus subsp. abscessus]